MITTNLFDQTDTKKIIDRKGLFSVIEYERDLSVSPEMSFQAYFASEMNVRKRQLVAELSGQTGIYIQAGEMQIMLGSGMSAKTGLTGAGDLMKKFVSSRVTGETVIKPHYAGTGTVVLNPSFRYILLTDMDEWNGGMVIEDGMFLACEDTVNLQVKTRTNVSSALFGNEGLFNSVFSGQGVVALESPVPEEELIVVNLIDDEIRIDGSMAVAWSDSLSFSVGKANDTLVGSVASGEGLANIYKGTGKILIAPVRCNWGISSPEN